LTRPSNGLEQFFQALGGQDRLKVLDLCGSPATTEYLFEQQQIPRPDPFYRALELAFGSGPAYLEPPSLDLWPDVHWQPDYKKSKRVNLDALTKAGGRLPFHDNSSPEEIRAAFGLSKKAFKQAIGALFKDRRIVITQHGIRLADAAKSAVKN
jgi:hypothetical protein